MRIEGSQRIVPSGRHGECQMAPPPPAAASRYWFVQRASEILEPMWTFDTRERRTPGAGLFAPLNATAYVAWLVAASSLLARTGARAIGVGPWAAGCAALLVFLAGFMTRAALESRHASNGALCGAVIVQAAAAPLSLWMLQDHLQAILLVLVAAQLPSLRGRRLAVAALALGDCALVAWLSRSQPAYKALQVSLAYLAFQLFAAIVSRAAYLAAESRRELLQTNRELRVARALVAEGARAQERLRLSRELHDIAGHKLTALKLQLAVELRHRPMETSATLVQCMKLADELLNDIRAVVSALRQDDAIDLRRALMALDPAVASIAVEFDLQPDAIVTDIAKAEALLRCAQEGLTNALRHGGATEIRIALARQEQDLVLSLEDNGVGYGSSVPAEGNGLKGLRERLEEFQGVVSLDRRVPRGCILKAVLPEPKAAC
jgi:signal transduction histidine kinase